MTSNRGTKFAAVREILETFDRGEITESTAERRLLVVTRHDQRDRTFVHQPGLIWLHDDSSIPIGGSDDL